MKTILLIIVFLAFTESYCQHSFEKDLSKLFGGIDLTLNDDKIIKRILKDKRFKCNYFENVGKSCSGLMTLDNYFQLAPEESFIEIYSEALDIETDTTFWGRYSIYNLTFSFKTSEINLVINEFNKIVSTFEKATDLTIKENDTWAEFFLRKRDKKPTLTILVQTEDCKAGDYCIKVRYNKKKEAE